MMAMQLMLMFAMVVSESESEILNCPEVVLLACPVNVDESLSKSDGSGPALKKWWTAFSLEATLARRVLNALRNYREMIYFM